MSQQLIFIALSNLQFHIGIRSIAPEIITLIANINANKVQILIPTMDKLA